MVLAASGCRTGIGEYISNGYKVGPNYQKPGAPVADEWIDSYNPHLRTGDVDYSAWWRIFEDPALDRLVTVAYQQNITLREAGFRIAESQAERAYTVGNLFPQQQSLFGNYTRFQRSTQTATFPQGGSLPAGLIRTNFSNWQLGGNLAWELDFWGRYRRAIEAADARLDAQIENYDDVLVLLVAEVATTYVDYRTFEQRLEYARQNVELQAESARVAEARRVAAAIDAEVDAPQAKSNLARTQSAIQALEIAQRRSMNRLAVLLGMPPHDLNYLLVSSKGIPRAPEDVTIDVPASLMRRRPDIRRQERLVAAQSAAIGIAESDLYPAVSINGTAYLDASSLSRLFNSKAWAGSVGPSFRWNVLNYGRLVNLINIEEARLQQQIALYQQTVLRANEEAENSIIGFLLYHDQIELLETSVREAQEAVRVTQLKYQGGQIDFNRVFTVEQLLVGQQDQLALSRGNSATSLIQLFRAMGGGWQIRLQQTQPYRLPAPGEFAPLPENLPPPPPVPVPLAPPMEP
jgi:NodT family efflux transporter outer membrane factor (OMF) lipoprotein